VHALGQVANFHTGSAIPCENLRPALQNFLPDDVVIRHVAEVDASFHATHSARRKRYRYVIHNTRIRDPFLRRYCWHYHALLDAAAMHAAAQELLGTHDFRCFETQFPNRATSVRTVSEATLGRCAGWTVWSADDHSLRNGQAAVVGEQQKQEADAGEFLWFDIVADGFLYNMVRSIVGTLVEVGRGRWTSDDIRRIINSQKRSEAGDTAPPQGLYLVHVDYDA
jgi:tRNA pseudouridine38-40 synthase